MTDLLIGAHEFAKLRESFLPGDKEGAAVLLAGLHRRRDGRIRLLARAVLVPDHSDYSDRSPAGVVLSPSFVARAAEMARKGDFSLVFVHTHIGPGDVQFSRVDDLGEQPLCEFLSRRLPDALNAALLISGTDVRCRRLGGGEPIRVAIAGEREEILHDPDDPSLDMGDERYDRQVRALGASVQRRLGRLRAAIVGLGGTGSIVAQQLVHLGVHDLILVDPDVVETTNLNRLVGANRSDVGHPKVFTAERYIRSVEPAAAIRAVTGDIIHVATARELLDADVIFGCTDSHGSRAVLQQIAYQYFIPCFDMGAVVAVREGRVPAAYGRNQLLAPGLGCLSCSGVVDSEQVRRDMLTAYERKADPYIIGGHDPAPAVIALNGIVASVAVSQLLSYLGGLPFGASYALYDASVPKLRQIYAAPLEGCSVCSPLGAYGRGDSWELWGRTD